MRGGVGFVYDKDRDLYAPNTVLNDDIRKITGEKMRIIASYRKNIKDSQYEECVYKAKKLDWTEIKYPEEYVYLQPDL